MTCLNINQFVGLSVILMYIILSGLLTVNWIRMIFEAFNTSSELYDRIYWPIIAVISVFCWCVLGYGILFD